MNCIFCKIVSNEIKSDIAYETKNIVVIKDVNPQAPTHLLAIPKKHYSTLLDCKDDAILAELFTAAAQAAKAAGIDKSGFRTIVNTNEEGGQTVFHLHMHILGGKPLSGRMG